VFPIFKCIVCTETKRLRFPPVAGSRGRPKLTTKKTATELPRRRNRRCVSFDNKDSKERCHVILQRLVVGVRAEDVSANNPVDSRYLKLQPNELPAAVLHENVNVQLLQPFLTPHAWQQLQQAIAERQQSDDWFCASCHNDLGTQRSVECTSCLDWFHCGCVGFKRKRKGDWFCCVCVYELMYCVV